MVITENLAKNTKLDTIIYDKKISGFGLRTTKAGIRTFLIRKRVNGRDRQITIGRYPEWSAELARKEACKIAVQMDQGIDLNDQRRQLREAPTCKDLWEDVYCKNILNRKGNDCRKNEQSMWVNYIKPAFGNKRLMDITRDDVIKMHRRITDLGKPVRANRVLAVTHCMFNQGQLSGWITNNPASKIKKNHEEARERFLRNEERERLFKVLKEHQNQKCATAIRLIMLTGARSGETFSAKFEQFDLESKVWTKPSSATKQKKLHRIPISDAVVDLVSQIRQTTNSEYLFPQKYNPSAHMIDIKKFWADVRVKAGIPDVRIHDLRHDFASILASQKCSLQIIGQLLGHSQITTTQRYAHLLDDPLRDATNQAAQIINNSNA